MTAAAVSPVLTTGIDLARRRITLRVLLRAHWVTALHDEQAGLNPSCRALAVTLSDSPESATAYYREAHSELWAETVALDLASSHDQHSPLGALCRRLDLGEAERGLLEVTAAVALDPTLGTLLGTLFGRPEFQHVHLPAAAGILGYASSMPWATDSAVFRWRLVWSEAVARAGSDALVIDPHVLHVLCGGSSIDPALGQRAEVVEPRPPFARWPVRETVDRICRLWASGRNVEVRVVGPAGSGRRTFAAAVSAELGAPLLTVDLVACEAGADAQLVLLAHREAVLLGLHPCLLVDRAPARHAAPPVSLRFVVHEDREAVAVSGDARPDDPVVVTVALPAMTVRERARLLGTAVPGMSRSECSALAARYRLRIGELWNILAAGATTAEEISTAAAATTRERMAGLGSVVPTPFERGDLIVDQATGDAFDAVLSEARVRGRALEGRQRLRGTGLSVLFHGPPGTGKTMAALVLARELGLPLVRIDVAAVVSKYIGETAKTLRRIFAEAAELDAVLFFDEADALFARRTELRDSHDRHANADTAYLLTLLEEHDGITVLASNQRTNLDPAFQRRLRHVLDFQAPGPAERERIWSRALGVTADDTPGHLNHAFVAVLAEIVELSGAQIESAALTALFTATDRAPRDVGICRTDVVAAVELELAKGGRSLRPSDRTRLIAHD